MDGAGDDIDLDIRWVETRGIYDGSLVADVKEAADILSKARERLDKSDVKLTAEVFLAEGIAYYSAMGIIAQDPLIWLNHLHKSHAFLVQSIQTHPTPSVYYHLALSFLRRLQRPLPTSQRIARLTAPLSSPDVHLHAHTYSLPSALPCTGLAVGGRPADVYASGISSNCS
ncbi:hypothetical protein D9619_008789 [Psilocybe cf. subviscida]|uniref:Uncharacterized protein n=1 Tax=Psilocybe cf. subviscida TaxID=2480587 RepID=A0A8H5F0G7_9AGAR|nr:hypothetical protein D9619_008789 [Psilocybe cf. subviscida]